MISHCSFYVLFLFSKFKYVFFFIILKSKDHHNNDMKFAEHLLYDIDLKTKFYFFVLLMYTFRKENNIYYRKIPR